MNAKVLESELTPRPTVLLYGFRDPVRRARLLRYLEGAGIRALLLSGEALEQPVGALLGLPGFAPAPPGLPGPAPEEELLVMFAFRENMLHELLDFFREQGLAPVELKAMVTPVNVHWSLRSLHAELQKERDWFRQQRRSAF